MIAEPPALAHEAGIHLVRLNKAIGLAITEIERALENGDWSHKARKKLFRMRGDLLMHHDDSEELGYRAAHTEAGMEL